MLCFLKSLHCSNGIKSWWKQSISSAILASRVGGDTARVATPVTSSTNPGCVTNSSFVVRTAFVENAGFQMVKAVSATDRGQASNIKFAASEPPDDSVREFRDRVLPVADLARDRTDRRVGHAAVVFSDLALRCPAQSADQLNHQEFHRV